MDWQDSASSKDNVLETEAHVVQASFFNQDINSIESNLFEYENKNSIIKSRKIIYNESKHRSRALTALRR
jgi:hypothetical protein